MKNYYEQSRLEMVDFLPPTYSKVLEIGCGVGNFSVNLQSNAEVWGVEPNKQSAEIAQKLMYTVLIGKYADVEKQIPNRYFDLVICNDVIEHMDDHEYFLNSICTKISDNKYLMASVPNVRYWRLLYDYIVKKEWTYRDRGILDKTHQRFFTEKSIKRSLINHGFSIMKFRGINNMASFKQKLFVRFLISITLGYYSDIQYMEFGLLAKKIMIGTTNNK